MKRHPYRIYCALAALECAAAAAWSLYDPQAGLLLSSTLRLLFAGAVGLLSLVFAGGLAFLLASPMGEVRLDRYLQARLASGNTWLDLLTLFGSGALAGAAALFVWNLPEIHTYHWYAGHFPDTLAGYETFLILLQRSLGLLALLSLLSAQSLGLLLIRFTQTGRSSGALTRQAVFRRVLIVAIVAASLLHWAILVSQATFFSDIPGWYWESQPRSFSLRTLLFLLLAALALGTAAFILRKPRAVLGGLGLVYLTGLALQFGIGVVSGEGLEWIRMKYAGSLHQSYAIFATQEELDPVDVVRDYETRFGTRMFPSTKPPGVILTYVLFERISHAFRPESSNTGRLLALTSLMAFVFPFLSFLVVVVLFGFARHLDGQRGALLPAMLYVLLPNVILIPVFLDQVFYPLLFLAGVWLMVEAVQRSSLWLALLSGLYFYTAIFFSFSMLPLLPFFLALVGLDFVRSSRWERAVRSVRLTSAVIAGLLVLFLFLKTAVGYDVINRYAIAMRVVRNYDFVLRVDGNAAAEVVDPGGETIQPGLGQILRAARLNLIEFGAACGFPVFLLFLSRSASIVLAFLRRRTTQQDWALGALLLTFLALNIYGQMQGEVSRLWLFWTPMVVLFAGAELKKRFAMRPTAILLVVLLQLITMFVTFQYQDFIV